VRREFGWGFHLQPDTSQPRFSAVLEDVAAPGGKEFLI